MKKIIKFNTSYGSQNMGDYIINKSVDNGMKFMFDNSFIVNYPTHTPVATFYQCSKKSGVMKYCNNVDFKFIAGTNLLPSNMFRPWPNWNVNIFNYKPYKNSILIGCGLNGKFEKANLYTRMLYKKILSKDYIHSVRDEKTKKFIESLGLKAINTGCATLWSLTDEFCKNIPKKKASKVIFTLTDYCKNVKNDTKLINILENNYKEIYFWVQGSNDYEYLKQITTNDKIKIIFSLDDYDKLLSKGEIDFVGTRLHAGIFAMQHKIRSIIISIDNRTSDMSETYNLVSIERDNIDSLDELINKEFETCINIDTSKIKEWKAQFK